jgi:hypothetical protein
VRAADADDVALHAWLRERLPFNQLPECIEWVEQFPLLPSGKLDVARLIGQSSSTRKAATVTVDSPAQARVLDVWMKVLSGDAPPGIDVNFFDAGGHSLQLLALRNELECAFELPIRIADLFRTPTIRLQAHWLESRA